MLRNSLLFGLIFLSGWRMNAQPVPAVGSFKSIDIANWNLNWFGKTQAGFGPSDDSLQIALVEDVLTRARIDLWIFSELVDTAAMLNIASKMGHHQLVISKHNQEQKNAVLFDTLLFRKGPMKMLAYNNYDSFSTGRFPLQVALIPKKAPLSDTLFVIALHLKANTGNDSQKMQAYLNRKLSSDWLAAYLKHQPVNKRILIAGDWNDDLDFSIYNNLPTPLVSCKKLDPGYVFLTRMLTDKHQSSTTGFDNPIDHQLASSALFSYSIADSTFVWKIDRYISKYAQNCSDHYPVVSRFSNHLNTIETEQQSDWNIYPNPADCRLNFSAENLLSIELWNYSGQPIFLDWRKGQDNLDIADLPEGVYCLRFGLENSVIFKTLIIRHD